ncbi:septation protein SepH [Calidifontibacter indicus]|uniref:DUF3071 family protein n=1 Tax=Calidifontibacter indicus TaxID=419650 RepID=A0A3D9UQ48_9MICO|nr:septation protein SepH [Calidifontibacter indicus]REF31386.1 DUF3071 family protein [Calidifontibacter indicus]
MRDLRFVGVDDEGTRLLLVDEDGQQHQVQIDDALRSAVRTVRPRSSDEGVDPNVRPRDVQAMLRSGLTIDEVAERTGWSPTKVGLFEPPIRAERDHVATTAQRLPLHTRVAGRDQTSTVGERVGERLAHRGVEAADITWNAYRGDRGWTIECRFPAGGRPRVATWRYDAQTQSLHPTDDEARWLSEEEQQPANLPFGRTTPASGVYDVVAEGGLDQSAPAARPVQRQSAPKIPHARVDEAEVATKQEPEAEPAAAEPEVEETEQKHSGPVDLVSVMRERSKARRRSGGRRKTDNSPNHPAGKGQSASAEHPDDESAVEEVDEATIGAEHGEQVAPHKPSVDDLGHDPVTGTADLFGLKEVEPLRREVVQPATEQPTEQPTEDAKEPTAEPDAQPDEDAVDEAAADSSPDDASDDVSDEPTTDESDESDESVEDAEPKPAAVKAAPTPEPESAPKRESESIVPERPSQARKGRPAVPSWDDIMFGKRGPKG